MSLLVELKRRNVFRVAAFYVVSSWLILQMADVLFGILRLPDWTLSFVAALLALGFIPALVISWVYEITPEGIKKESEIDRTQSITPNTGKRLDRMIIVALVAVIGLLLVDRFWNGDLDGPPSTGQNPIAMTDAPAAGAVGSVDSSPQQDLSVAVLPFANMSSDAENEYFADGLTEELLNALAQIDSLKVAGRTSSFYFKGKNEDLKAIGAQLGVAHVLEGSVRKVGEQVRITAQLIKVDDGFHLWSDTFNRDLSDIFKVQEEISVAIAEALKLELGLVARGSVAVTENLEAYEYFLEARARIAGRNDIARAMNLLERALALDPSFAEAWGQLAQAHSLAHYYNIGSFSENLSNAQQAAERALALKPDLVIALSAKADVLRDSYHWAEAEAQYREALALNPDELEANSQYGQLLMRAGYLEEALPYSLKAREMEPLSVIKNTIYAWNLMLLQRFDDAAPIIEMAIEMAPDFELANLVRFWFDALTGRIRDGELYLTRHLQSLRASDRLIESTLRAFQLTVDGERDKALKQIQMSIEIAGRQSFYDNWNYLNVFAVLANYSGDATFALDAYQDRASFGGRRFFDSIFLWSPDYADLRRAPGFAEVARDIGLVAFWQERGAPDLCATTRDGGFACE